MRQHTGNDGTTPARCASDQYILSVPAVDAGMCFVQRSVSDSTTPSSNVTNESPPVRNIVRHVVTDSKRLDQMVSIVQGVADNVLIDSVLRITKVFNRRRNA